MYAYRVPTTQLWPFLDAVRAYYIEHNLAYTVMGEIARRADDAALAHARQWANHTELHVTLQLFQDGETWLLRVLERGYFFLNHWRQVAAYLTPVFYDDRSDVPSDAEANAAIAERLDEQIAGRRYLLAPLIDTAELLHYFWNHTPAHGGQP
jgi:hypothetical protein